MRDTTLPGEQREKDVGMSIGSPYHEGDATPVYYSSKQLQVTGMKITVGSSVHPISAVTSIEVLVKNGAYLMDVLRILVVGLLLVVGGGVVARVMDVRPWISMMGVATVLAGVYGVCRFMQEKTLHVGFASGDSVKVAMWDSKTVWAMHSAVEQALTWNINHSGPSPSVADELSKLSELRDRGAISAEDWSRSKDLFLGKQPDAQQRTVQQLRQLHDLQKSGVLSESEFNMKKWDVLSRS